MTQKYKYQLVLSLVFLVYCRLFNSDFNVQIHHHYFDDESVLSLRWWQNTLVSTSHIFLSVYLSAGKGWSVLPGVRKSCWAMLSCGNNLTLIISIETLHRGIHKQSRLFEHRFTDYVNIYSNENMSIEFTSVLHAELVFVLRSFQYVHTERLYFNVDPLYFNHIIGCLCV